MPDTFADTVDVLYGLPKFRDDISLDPIRDCLAALDHPHRAFPAVHVAGTNGKGSTATLLADALSNAGYTTGLFTSPHLVDPRERIRIDGEKIPRDVLVDNAARVLDTGADVSFFEAMTAVAFLQFADRDVDIAVVETGMGGRHDATNVVEPEASIITNVAREHTRWLGDTRAEIARDLAGIIRDAPVVTGATGDAGDVIERAARDRGAPLRHVEPRATLAADGFELTLDIDGDRVDTRLAGTFQVDNVDTVLTTIDVLPRDVPRDAVHEALRTTRLPGRMDVVARNPLTVLDGAHNPAAMERLAETFDAVDGPVTAAVSIMADKEYERMLSTLGSFVDHMVLSAAGIDRAADPEALAGAAPASHEIVRDPSDALARAREHMDGTALATGSLYFVGDILRAR